MSDLSAFLNPVQEENVKFVASKRFLDENGEPVEWEIKSITGDEDTALRKTCYYRRPINGSRYIQEFNHAKYINILATECTVFPNLNDKSLQDRYHVMSNDALLRGMLKPGELLAYSVKVQEVNGFENEQELEEEAKN